MKILTAIEICLGIIIVFTAIFFEIKENKRVRVINDRKRKSKKNNEKGR